MHKIIVSDKSFSTIRTVSHIQIEPLLYYINVTMRKNDGCGLVYMYVILFCLAIIALITQFGLIYAECVI